MDPWIIDSGMATRKKRTWKPGRRAPAHYRPGSPVCEFEQFEFRGLNVKDGTNRQQQKSDMDIDTGERPRLARCYMYNVAGRR